MATVLNRTTKALITSANTVEYPDTDWIIEPDLSAVVGYPSKYWLINGDAVTLIDQAARDAVDAAELTAMRDAIANGMDNLESYTRAFAQVVLDEINILRTNDALPTRTLAQLKTAVRGKLGS